MTGRKGRVVSTDDGISYESRSETDVPLEILNLTEKQRFMDGEKVSLYSVSHIYKIINYLSYSRNEKFLFTFELCWRDKIEVYLI